MINSLKTLVSSANIPFISGGGNSHVSNHLQHRPRMATVALLLLTFSFFNITSARAEKLCQSNYTGTIGALGSKTVQVSVGTIGTNMYRVVFESDFAMTGSLTYVNTSENSNLCLDNTTKTILNGGKRIFFDMPSTSAPVFKNAIQVKTSAGNYTLTGTAVNSVDWSQTTAECSALVGNDCSGRSTEKSEGNDFTNGYEYDFSSDGSGNVNISVTFLDTPDGLTSPELYMLYESGGEFGGPTSMTWNSSTHTASHTLTGQTGTIYFKVRVPYSGGVFVTKKFTIKVGAPCDSDSPSPEPGGETLDCEGHTFYFANNYWKFATPTAHLYNSGNGHTTTWPGYKMTQVSGTAGIYSVTYDNDPYADDYEKVIFSNNGTDKLGGKDISDCKYYDNDGDVHDNLSDVARHIYFVRNDSATSWNPPHARLYYETRNNGDAGAAMANTGLSNIDSHDLFSIIVPIYNNVGFKESSSYTNASAYSYIDNSFQDYSIFNYEHNTWYQTQNIYLTGSMNSWATDNASYKFSDWDRTSSTYVTLLTPPLTAATTYDFKVITGGVDRGLNADNTYSANNQTKRLYQGGAQEANVHLTTDVAGRYLFRYDVSAGKLTIFFPPSMLTANLDSRAITSAVLNVASTRGTQYRVVDNSNGINQVLTPTANQITVTGLTEGTLYTFTVTALDDNNTESSNSITLDPFCTLLETAPTAPTYDECQVLSVYSQYYRSLQASFSHWESGSTKTDRVVDGVNMWEVNVGTAWNDGGYGIEWGNQTFDISDYTGLHFDVWTPTATTIYVTPINRNSAYNGNDSEVRHSGETTTARAWTSVNIPISKFTGAINRNYQLKIEGNKGTPMFITNIFYYKTDACPSDPTPTDHPKGIGTAQEQNEWMYRNDNGNIAGGATNNVIDYYVATLGNEILYKVVTTDAQTMWPDFNPFLYVLDGSNNRVAEFQGTRNAENTQATYEGTIPGSVGASQFDWNWLVPLVGGTHHWNGHSISEKMTYKRGYINNPNDDVTAPTITGATKDEVGTDTVITITGATDNSGQLFYYFEDLDNGIAHISLANTYKVPITENGKIYNIKCYAVDFNGNLSTPQTVTLKMALSSSFNLALKKPVYMGRNSSYVAGTNYSLSNDGIYNGESRWTTGDHGNPPTTNYDAEEWFYVDLCGYYTLSQVKIWFENAYPTSYIIQTAETVPDDPKDDTKWRTVYTSSGDPKHSGNDLSTPDKVAEYENAYTVTTPARYVRIKSKNNALPQWGFSMWEFEVYGTAMVAKDATAPTVTTAEATAIINGDMQLHLVADDGSNFFRIKDNQTGEVFLLEADGSGHVLMTNKTYEYCTEYSFDIQAMDAAANLSVVTPITPTVAPPADYNLVSTRASASAGHEAQAASQAIDGDATTQWGSEGGADDQHWITVDLEKRYSISTIKMSWEKACPKNYYLKASLDGTHFYPIGHYRTIPAISADGSEYETYSVESGVEAQYLQMYSVENNTGYGTSIWEFEAYGACAEGGTKPIMTFADVHDTYLSNSGARVLIEVGAWDDATAFKDLRYKLVFTAGLSETRSNQEATEGLISLTGLTKGTVYTVQIYAVDEGGQESENYKELTFTPQVNLYYLTGDATGANGVWGGALSSEESAATRRFGTTENEGIYSYSIIVNGAEQQYRPYLDLEQDLVYRDDLLHWSDEDNQVITGHNGETIEVFAKDKDHFVSIFDELKVYGNAVFADEGSAFTMAYAGNHKFVWQGRVQAGTFRIIVNNNHSGITDNSRVRIMNDDSFENSSAWTHAKLTFDMEAWTWSWEEIDSEEFCEYSGAAGSGIVGLNGSRALQGNETYKLFAYMSGNNWVVEIAFPTGAGKVYLQPFNAASGTDRTQFEMPHLGGNLYSVSLTPEQIATLYTADGIVRYTVKIEVAGGSDICQTEIHYFDLSNGVCAPDYFDIYHWDDASEGKRTSYNGGIIMQPIRYFRHFEHTDWCAIAFPFEVSRVAVYDNNDSREYDLYPRFYNGTKDVEGYYWLKTFPDWDNTPVSIANFKGTWQQLTYNTEKTGATPEEEADLATHVLPSKNVPYVISFTDGSYYRTNWVIFYGEGGQTIASEADGQCENSITGSEEVVKLQRNNMMKPTETKSNIYMLEEGYDIYARYTQPIPAFESYVVGTSSVQTKYRIIRLRGETTPDTGTTTGLGDVPTTAGWKGDIYSVSGAKVATFASRDTMEHYLESLSPGIYVIRTASQILKIVVP